MTDHKSKIIYTKTDEVFWQRIHYCQSLENLLQKQELKWK